MNVKTLWRRVRKSLSAPTDIERQLLGIRAAAAGITVTPRNAQECVAVRAAVQVVAEAIGQLPVHVYRKAKDGTRDRDSGHPAYAVMHDAATEWQSAHEFRELVTRDALLWGNGYAFILRDSDDNPVELHRLEPQNVAVEVDEATREPTYTYTTGSTKEVYAFTDVLHIRAPSCDGIVGDSPVYIARDAIALAMAMERHSSTLFKNGGRPSGVITMPGDLGETPASEFVKSWQDTYSGDGNGGVAILEGGATYSTVTMSSVESQLIEARRFSIEEIGRIYRVPPIFLGDYGRATWSNNEAQGTQLVQYCLMPWIKRWQGELQLKLLTPEARKEYFFEFLVDDLLRADTAARYEAYSKGIASRFLSPNDVRAKENLPPYEGGSEYLNPNTTAGTAPVATPAAEPEKEPA